MPKNAKSPGSAAEAEAFGKRLVTLLEASGRDRFGAGAYLATRYKVATVTANAWLNGEYRPSIPRSRQIAEDHGTTFDELYFGRTPRAVAGPDGLPLSPEEHELIAKYRAADKVNQEMIFDLIDVVLGKKPDGDREVDPR